MPGPCNSRKKRKQKGDKEKALTKRSVLKEVEQNLAKMDAPINELTEGSGNETCHFTSETIGFKERAIMDRESCPVGESSREHRAQPRTTSSTQSADGQIMVSPTILSSLGNPFITDPGNGPRVKNTEAFLTSFFCPPLSLKDEACAAFAREEVLTVLEAVLPREIALIVWFNKTRKYGRICPACQRLYRLGDTLIDPINGVLVDVNDPQTPPQVLREQQLSGICSMPCFLLASYTSYPYIAEVARGAWGYLTEELDAQTRSLLDATDPQTAALLRYGLAAWAPSQGPESEEMDEEPSDQGIGRAMRLTRRLDLGLGEVLDALAWYEEEKKKVGATIGREGEEEVERVMEKLTRTEDDADMEGWKSDDEQTTDAFSPTLSAPKGVRA